MVGTISLVVVFGLRVVAPRIPGALVLVVGGLLASYLFDLGDRGVALVGDVPRGLPSFAVPDLGLMWDHVIPVALGAFALMLIGFSQTAGDARAFAAKHRYQIDVNQESVAQSAANIGAGLFQGMPVSTSLSASSLNDHSGARSGLASITSGVTVLLTLLVLAPLFSQLPKPVLGALIIEAVVMGMMNVPEMRRIYRVQRFDFWVASPRSSARSPSGCWPASSSGSVSRCSGWSRSRPSLRCRHWGASAAPRSTATWSRTPTTSSPSGSRWSDSMADSSSRRPTRWRTGSARSSRRVRR